MCGIVGYVGPDQALPITDRGASPPRVPGIRLGGRRRPRRRRRRSSSAPGKLSVLEEALAAEGAPPGRAGVGHTRWATHGAPTDRNAHPHTDCTGRLAVIHNGIIENHQALRDRLEKAGHAFASDTDTECIAHLLEEHFQGHLGDAVRATVKELDGAYAIVVAVRRRPRA